MIEGTVAPGEVPPPPTPQIADVEDTNPPLENEVTPAAAPAAMTAPLTPSTSDSEISQQVCDELFPGMQLGDLSTGQMRDVLAVARRRPAAEKKRAGEGKVKNEQDIGKKAGFNFSSPLLLAS